MSRCYEFCPETRFADLRCSGPQGHPGAHLAVPAIGKVVVWGNRADPQARLEGMAAMAANMLSTFASTGTGETSASVERDLETAVAEQLAAIHDSLPADWRGRIEVEPIPPELTDTYDVAQGSAIKNCDHSRSSHNASISMGQRQCDDCGRYFIKRSWWE